MGETEQLKEMIEEDIAYCNQIWEEYSHDAEAMEALFQKMLFRYLDKIQYLADGLKVVSPYDDKANMADIYRNNLNLLLSRMKAFLDNGCQNEGLEEYYLVQDKKGASFIEGYTGSFNQARLEISNMDWINIQERKETLDKIDEIEAIILRRQTRKEKWDTLRPYVLWVSGKELEIAIRILPLFLKIETL